MSRRENPFQEEREVYQQIEIPDELQYLVKKSIKRAEKLRLAKRKRLIIRSIASVAALLFLTLTIGVNSSYAVSKKVSKMPVVRSVAKVLTVRKYTAEKAADPELQQELAEAQENSEIPVDGLVIEEIPEETVEVQPEHTEIIDVPMTEEEAIILEGYEKWAKELTIEKLDLVTELYEVPVVEEEEVETEVTAQEDSTKKEDVTKETSAKETTTKETTVKESTSKEMTAKETTAKEGNAEKKETVAKEAVSGNDKTAQETPQDTKKEQTADASKEGQEISKEAEDDKRLDTILLAELPKEEIRLYGYHENGAVRGVALRIKDRFTCFDWTYLDSRGKLPELSYADANEDGEKEILVFLYNDQNDTQEEETGSDSASANGDTTAKSATEETLTDSKTANKDTKPVEETKSEAGKSTVEANKATSAADTQKTEADGKNSDTSKTTDSSKTTDNSKTTDTGKVAEAISENKDKDVTASESGKSSDEEAVSANDQEDSMEKKSLDDVSEIWMVCVTEEEMKPELVSLEEKESPILAFIKSLFEQ